MTTKDSSMRFTTHPDEQLTYSIRGAIFRVYNALGPGLLESVYEEALCYELIKSGLTVVTQQEIPIFYDNTILKTPLRLDMLVNQRVIVELKSVQNMLPIFGKQIMTYLRLKHLHTGILVNFNTIDIINSTQTIYNTRDK